MESDEEWSMNKKLIDLSMKDVRRSVSGLLVLLISSYFCPAKVGNSMCFMEYNSEIRVPFKGVI